MKMRYIVISAFALLIIITGAVLLSSNQDKEFLLATTTSVDNTGLLDMLIEEFESQYDYDVQVIAKGTGTSIQMARDGEVDAILVHAPSLELEFVNDGYGLDRTTLWYNYFLIVGPATDPANISDTTTLVEAMTAIHNAGEAGQTKFFSRGDNSGTNVMELSLWDSASLTPDAAVQDWYVETGTGMSGTLTVASEEEGYTLTDMGTFAQLSATDDTFELVELYSEDELLYNPYSYMRINPEKWPEVNEQAGKDFLAFLLDPDTVDKVQNYIFSDVVLFTPISDES